MMFKTQLAEITKKVLASSSPLEEILTATELSGFYEQFTHVDEQALHAQKQNEVHLQGGIALSSYDAGVCLDDHIRTARFIKGAYNAFRTLASRFPGQQLNVLYAGCGPYATILLPLLPLFDPNAFDLVFLDINRGSLDSVKQLIRQIGLEEYSIHLECGNAIEYKTPRKLHLVVTETMFEALIREPQVAITGNLAAQLEEEGILIPEDIRIDLAYTFFAKEPFLHPGPGSVLKEPYPHQLMVDTLFSINKERHFYRQNAVPGIFESGTYEVPAGFSDHPDICLFTTLRIFGSVMLHSAESAITNPYCIVSLYNLPAGSRFNLVYNYAGVPGWSYQLKGQKTG